MCIQRYKAKEKYIHIYMSDYSDYSDYSTSMRLLAIYMSINTERMSIVEAEERAC